MPKGEAQDVNPANAHLMYNEVSSSHTILIDTEKLNLHT